MQCILSKYPVAGLLFFFGIFWTGTAFSQLCEQPAGVMVSVQGAVERLAHGQSRWRPIALKDALCVGDSVRVGENSRADIALANDAVLRINAGSALILQPIKENRIWVLDVLRGAMHFFSRRPRSLELRTPTLVAGVRGTEFFLKTDTRQTFLSIFEGAVLASNEAGELRLTSGQSAVAEKGRAPVLRLVAKPRDAVQWALYYPPVLYNIPEYILKVDPKSIRDPDLLVQRAALLLDVGRVEKASADLERALQLDPSLSTATALQAIVALVRSEKDLALRLAQKAVETGPDTAAARIALSYAQQARFDLKSARKSLEEAVTVEPENAMAWARLSEIQTSFGNLDAALNSARKAESLAPNLSWTQMVLGFAYLMQVRVDPAKAAFEKAIRLDQAAPLPRLGLGLAKIREGDLKEGRREIEIAASLDPNSSIIRSYLGKAYYEEKRTGLDDREYAIAKELDPRDPTPYFYDAVNLQTQNQPVKALRNYQKAVELNDNRAVYRSSLQLDADLAARSAALARIYHDLGFGQLGLAQGYQSVNTDPTSFSAHRFLADTYAALPRHEIARVSELLQSQLLQPLNITPIQPGLAESNLFLLSALGVTQPSVNEFNNLMITRNRGAVQTTGLAGGNDTWAGESIISGIYNDLSLSAGYTRFETEGWRMNADQEDEIGNIFAQWEITHKTGIQAEYRYRDSQRGALQMRFEPDDFRPNQRENEKMDVLRLGIRHAFSPGSVLIGNFSYQEKDFTQQNRQGMLSDPFSFIIEPRETDRDREAFGGELQYLFQSHSMKVVTGAGYFDIDSQESQAVEVFYPSPPFPPPPIGPGGTTDILVTPSDLSTEHTILYLYSYINFPANLTWTIGASGDFFDSASFERPSNDQLNPKFGITWTPFPGTILRGAAFRTLNKTLVTDQTIEPTQIAGFNQFYDEADGTQAWRYGAGIDQKLTGSLSIGMEYSQRDLTVPFVIKGSPPGELNWDESLLRAYLYWTPHESVALTADYLYEELDRSERFGDGALHVDTHYLPLGVNFFHPSGLSLYLKGTYVDQKGRFERIETAGTFTPGQDAFWLFDAAASYRLPERYGFLTLGISNIFDENFKFFDTDRDNPRIQPERFVFGKITLAFP